MMMKKTAGSPRREENSEEENTNPRKEKERRKEENHSKEDLRVIQKGKEKDIMEMRIPKQLTTEKEERKENLSEKERKKEKIMKKVNTREESLERARLMRPKPQLLLQTVLLLPLLRMLLHGIQTLIGKKIISTTHNGPARTGLHGKTEHTLPINPSGTNPILNTHSP